MASKNVIQINSLSDHSYESLSESDIDMGGGIIAEVKTTLHNAILKEMREKEQAETDAIYDSYSYVVDEFLLNGGQVIADDDTVDAVVIRWKDYDERAKVVESLDKPKITFLKDIRYLKVKSRITNRRTNAEVEAEKEEVIEDKGGK